MSNSPQRRRLRCVFHYKVDEMLRPEHRETYLALLRELRTTIDVAHDWLLERGYTLSRSAVARHRRRLLSGEAEQKAALDKAVAFARLAGSPGAPDFSAGAEVQLQCIVFEHLLALGDRLHEGTEDDQDGDAWEGRGGADKSIAPIPASELLTLSRLVAQCTDLGIARIRANLARPKPAAPSTPSPSSPEDAGQRDAKLREEIEEILFGPKRSKPSPPASEDARRQRCPR